MESRNQILPAWIVEMWINKPCVINVKAEGLKGRLLFSLVFILGSFFCSAHSFPSYSQEDNFTELEEMLDPPLATEYHLEYHSYRYNSHVSYALWQQLTPYFLPVCHPIKRGLDCLFQKQRVTQSQEAFEKAGFAKPKIRKSDNILIGKHPQFKNYILKVFLDTQPVVNEWEHWIRRIEGAQAIQACITRHDFRHVVVPKKWIYPLPEEPSPPLSLNDHRKNFILVAENMYILSTKENLKAFKTHLSPQILDELYVLLIEEGLIDSVFPSNIPFTKTGKLAFVDTEHHYPERCMPYDKLNKLTPFLSPSMQHYWLSLIERK